MKKLLSLILLCAVLLSLAACSDPAIGEAPAEASISAESSQAPEAVIELKGDSVKCAARGVAVSGSVVTIGAPGAYTVRGTLSDGRIIIDLKETPGKVTLFLDGADITCLTDSAIYLAQAKELNLVLAAGSENRIVSGTEADLDSYNELRQGAAIFAEDDLDIQGEGALTVLGYLNNGITCKDDLKLKGGRLLVFGVNNGVRASESVTMSGGTVDIESGNDGLKTSSAKKADKGFVQIDGGTLSVVSGGDGVSAETELRILGGSITVTAEGDPAEASCKGLKGKTGVTISGGSVSVTADDHALRSGAGLAISDGVLQLRSRQGKGIAAETELTVSGGTLSVQSSDDGMVSADTVRVSGGELLIVSGADGTQGGKKGTGFASEVGTVSIEGGRTLVSAFNKPVDAKASFMITGGTLFTCGSGTPSPSSEIPWLLYTVRGSSGDELLVKLDGAPAMTAAYSYSSVFFADPALSEGESYPLQAGSQTQEGKASK